MGVLPQNVTLRRAVQADAEALVALGRQTFLETFCKKLGCRYAEEDLRAYMAQAYDLGTHRAELADRSFYYSVAERAGECVGYAKATPCKLLAEPQPGRDYELCRLYIRADAQGNGIGSLLMEDVLAQARAGRYSMIYLGVWEKNFDAQRFYARFGFQPVGEYTFYVGSHADRELIWRRAV